MNEAMTYQPLAPEVLQTLRHLDACALANAIQTLHQRLTDGLRNQLRFDLADYKGFSAVCGHRALSIVASPIKSVIPGSWTTVHCVSGLYSFIAAAVLAVFSPKLRW